MTGCSVPFEKSHVKDAPNIDPDGELSRSEERSSTSTTASATTTRRPAAGPGPGRTGNGDGVYDRDRGDAEGTVGRDTSGPTTDDAMTRSEEELRVGTAERESGKARLRKYVVTEEVQKTVPVRREEVRVEREPITDANVGDATDGPAISEEEHEVMLHAEEAVVEKRAVPKERVRLDKDVVEEEQQVSETRLEGADRRRRRRGAPLAIAHAGAGGSPAPAVVAFRRPAGSARRIRVRGCACCCSASG